MTNTEPTNRDRARWAQHALAVFTAETYSGDHPDTMHRGDLETAISDLICNLLHFAREHAFDVDTLLQHAFDHFEAELAEEVQP